MSLVAGCALAASSGVAAARDFVGYYPGYAIYERSVEASSLPGAQLTDINYAFANISAGGRIALGDRQADIRRVPPGIRASACLGGSRPQYQYCGNFLALQRLKERYPRLRLLISIGGWEWSSRFPQVAASASSRARFAASVAEFVYTYDFDGVDIDWEFPVSGGQRPGRRADKANFTRLMGALRSRLDALRRAHRRRAPYRLTAAIAAGPDQIRTSYDMRALARHVDRFNVMGYDFNAPGFSSVVGDNAPLRGAGDSIERTIAAYRATGVSMRKLNLGMPFYGYAWAGTGGRGQRFSGSAVDGEVPYRTIISRYNVFSGYARTENAALGAVSLYNPATRIFISYDDPWSLALKTRAAINAGMAGVMVWELSEDTGAHALVGAIAGVLRGP